jgi:DNA replication regulator DPB11
LTGATYDEQLSAKTSVIVCNSKTPNAQKLKFATDRRIPAVHATWLWDCLRTSQLQPYGKYQLNTIVLPHQQKSKSVPRPQAATEIPAAARPSTKDKSLLQKRNDRLTKKPSKPRGALDLAPSAEVTPASTTDSVVHVNTNNNDSVFDDDGVSIPGLDGPALLPLQDISANSPRRPSITSLDSKHVSRERSSSAESLIRPIPARKSGPAKEPTLDSVIPPADSVVSADSAIPAPTEPPVPPPPEPAAEKDYSDILAQLRANRKPLPSPADQNSSTRRRGRRQLGRATSTRSNDSGAESSGQLNLDGDDDKEQAQAYQPSQELGWDSPGAAKARETMMKRLGGRVTESSVRVEGIGVVRDVASENGGRVVRKRR